SEDGIEDPGRREGDHHPLVDRAADTDRTTAGPISLVAADNSDDQPEQRSLRDRCPDVGRGGVGEAQLEERGRVRAVGGTAQVRPAMTPQASETMSIKAVMMIIAITRGTISVRNGSTPRTSIASISSRVRRAPRSAVIAVPTTPATIIASIQG